MNSPKSDRVGLRCDVLVMGSDGQDVGTRKELREDDFLVARPLDRDVYVPLSAVKEILGHRVVLMVPAAEVGEQGWPMPPLLE